MSAMQMDNLITPAAEADNIKAADVIDGVPPRKDLSRGLRARY